MTTIRRAPRPKTGRVRRAALGLLVALGLFHATAARADNQVRILFDDIDDAYTPAVTQPNPPTDGCRPAVDDSDDNGCVTQAAGSVDDGDDGRD